MNILYGKPIADAILADLKKKIAEEGKLPGLAVVLVGADKASQIYVNLKKKRAEEIGTTFSLYYFEDNVNEGEIIQTIEWLNKDKDINGIIVQLPLPGGFDREKIINTIDPRKDVDGFHPENVKLFKKGEQIFWPVFPKAIMKMVEVSDGMVEKKKSIVLANSAVFGEIMTKALTLKGIEARYVLEKDLAEKKEEFRQADVVVSAVGKPELIDSRMVKAGVLIVDGGISREGEDIVGDVDFDSMKDRVGTLTPVPGGVGPVTIACLLDNVYLAFKKQNN